MTRGKNWSTRNLLKGHLLKPRDTQLPDVRHVTCSVFGQRVGRSLGAAMLGGMTIGMTRVQVWGSFWKAEVRWPEACPCKRTPSGISQGSMSMLSSAFSPLAVGGGRLLWAAWALLTAAGPFGWCLGRGGLLVVVACFLCVGAQGCGAVTSVLC